ncbi:hypothetical protein CEXT_383531 [Caerostris extrusa]|uniref:Uncharacterized protein n=1 Tax=Caerostris extrusa TaxID=172846 RepID=A0AAV4Q634_CAEEX|nr:hypothetical protein CEXT_383531 [Caerostris extrusa]
MKSIVYQKLLGHSSWKKYPDRRPSTTNRMLGVEGRGGGPRGMRRAFSSIRYRGRRFVDRTPRTRLLVQTLQNTYETEISTKVTLDTLLTRVLPPSANEVVSAKQRIHVFLNNELLGSPEVRMNTAHKLSAGILLPSFGKQSLLSVHVPQ